MRRSRMPVYTPSLEVVRILGTHSKLTNGLSKLEYFAGLAMQGLLANGYYRTNQNWHEELPYRSILFAKELLKQLEDENNKG